MPHQGLRNTIRVVTLGSPGVTTLLLLVLADALRVGLPVYHLQIAKLTIDRLRGTFEIEQAGPKWLRDLLDDHFDRGAEVLDDIVEVDLNSTDAIDSDLAKLAALTRLRDLHLSNTRITDA